MTIKLNFQDEIASSSPTVLYHGSILDFDFFKVFPLARGNCFLENPVLYDFHFIVENPSSKLVWKTSSTIPLSFPFPFFMQYFSFVDYLDGFDVNYVLTVSVSKPTFGGTF